MFVLAALTLLMQDPVRQGMDLFLAGKIEDSIKAFDQAIARDPSSGPYLWQRGIALYYAGRFQDCKAQFESHRKVNADDVENSAWHYLCTARAESPAKAKRLLIPIQRDARPNMMRILDLYAGKANEDDVLRTAGDPTAKFFAYLYIGLFWEANGDMAKAKPWLKRANDASRDEDYMGAVARIHWSRLH